MAVGLPETFIYLGFSPYQILFAVLPTDTERGQHAFSLTSANSLFFFCSDPAFLSLSLSLSLLRLLKFLQVLISCNVHPNPGPIFSCFLCVGVTWRSRTMISLLQVGTFKVHLPLSLEFNSGFFTIIFTVLHISFPTIILTYLIFFIVLPVAVSLAISPLLLFLMGGAALTHLALSLFTIS